MKKVPSVPLFVFVSFFSFFCCNCSIAADTLTPSRSLIDGEALVSAGGTFALVFFSPGMSKKRYVGIQYNKISLSSPTVVWVANRRNPIPDSTGSLKLDSGGALTIDTKISNIILFSPPASLGNPIAQLLDNGNFVVREANRTDLFAWQSFDYPTNTLLPGMKLGLDRRTGLNRNVMAWQSADDPSPGSYVTYLEINGNAQLPQIVTASGAGIRRGRSGPWNGVEFSNVAETTSFRGLSFKLVNNQDEVYYMYDTVNLSIISRLVVDNSDFVVRFVWIESTAKWNPLWYIPKGNCLKYSPCGPNGLCNSDALPMCSCLPGFQPKAPLEWVLRDVFAGCVRSTALDCQNGTDGFMVSHVSLPDTSTAMADMSIGLVECRARCLRDCSCTGYTSANISAGESGCLMWSSELVDLRVLANGRGQDLYVRLAFADLARLSSKSSRKSKGKVVVTVVAVSFAILVAACIGVRSRKKKRRISKEENRQSWDDVVLPLFRWDTIVAATGNFTAENLLGQGGFGPVYKGKLTDGQEIAVKKLSKTSEQGADEFRNEVVLIAKLQHRNLVQLLGYCSQGGERVLVYEFMPNKSLDVFLFDGAVCLDWRTRYNIILGIAQGLVYLHRDSRFRIIHRDLKASNILLDSEMNPKISDFGLARTFRSSEAFTRTSRVVGTYGYISPEYTFEGIFSVKSDVFSFGVLLLEIISGERNRGVFRSEPHVYLLDHAWSLWYEGRGMEFVDPSIRSPCSENQVMKCIKIGLLCVQEKPEDRPTMSSIIVMLARDDSSSLPEPKPPGFAAINLSQVGAAPTANEANSPNFVTITAPLGR